MDPHRRWLAVVLALTAALVALAVAANLVIDPWGLLERGRWTGVNAAKPRIEVYVRQHKAFAIARVRPNAIILGTSRAEAGLRPEHPALANVRPAYNLALPNAQIDETFAYLRAAHETHALKLAVVGLDFFAFNPIAADAAEPEALRMLRRPWGRLSPFLTLGMLKDSIATVGAQFRGEPDFLDAAGQSTIAMWSAMEARRGGPAGMARSDRAQYESGMYRFDAAGFATAAGRRPLQVFRDMLSYADSRGIELKLFISPGHAEDLETIDRLGLWPLYEEWKTRLASIAAAANLVLWDFSGYTPYSTEPLRGAAATRWWWGAAHYQRELGDLMLDRLFGAAAPAGLGVPVTPANIGAHLAGVRRARDDWRRAQR